MAVLVLVSTTSFTVQKRYCHDDLIGVSVFNSMEDCNEKEKVSLDCNTLSDDCCTDEFNVYYGQDNLKQDASDEILFSQKTFLSAIVFSHFSLLEGQPIVHFPYKGYLPPTLTYERTVLGQVFLI